MSRFISSHDDSSPLSDSQSQTQSSYHTTTAIVDKVNSIQLNEASTLPLPLSIPQSSPQQQKHL